MAMMLGSTIIYFPIVNNYFLTDDFQHMYGSQAAPGV
jgi:hypothetical protein